MTIRGVIPPEYQNGVIPPEYQNVTDTNVGKMTEKDAIHEIEMMEQMECACPDCERRRPALQMAIEALRFQQSVVRCKDCIHYSNPEIGWCDIHSHMTSTSLDDWTTFDDNSFCSDGERRDEE